MSQTPQVIGRLPALPACPTCLDSSIFTHTRVPAIWPSQLFALSRFDAPRQGAFRSVQTPHVLLASLTHKNVHPHPPISTLLALAPRCEAGRLAALAQRHPCAHPQSTCSDAASDEPQVRAHATRRLRPRLQARQRTLPPHHSRSACRLHSRRRRLSPRCLQLQGRQCSDRHSGGTAQPAGHLGRRGQPRSPLNGPGLRRQPAAVV